VSFTDSLIRVVCASTSDVEAGRLSRKRSWSVKA
jgi:hypothetical protein